MAMSEFRRQICFIFTIFQFTVLIVKFGDASFLGTIAASFSEQVGEPFWNLNYGSYYKGPVCNPSEPIRYPKSKQAVINIVREAISKGTTCKAFGDRHSATDIICTNGIPIDMTGILGMRMNPDNTVTVGTGVTLRDLCNFLMRHGRALKTTPGYGSITVGGAVGTGAHGSSVKHTSSISEQVVGLEIVDGFGYVRRISAPQDLNAFRVHLGLLGIVLELTLATHPLYKVYAHNYATSDEILFNGQGVQMAKEADQISFYWFPSSSKVVVANWTIVDVRTPGNSFTNDHVPSTYTAFNLFSTPLGELAQAFDSIETNTLLQTYTYFTLFTKVPLFVPIYTEDGVTLQNPAVGYYHNMFAPICKTSGDLQCPWLHGPNNITYLDNEIAFDLEELPNYVRIVKDILSKYPARFMEQGILMRFSAPTETYMSTSYRRISCHFEFYMATRKNPYEDPSAGLAAYQAMLQTLAYNFNGRSHWGKSGMFYHSRDQLQRKLDPSARLAFLAKMQEYDPNGVFMNDFGYRLKGTGTRMNVDPATQHCALLDNCVCSWSGDCANDQVCSQIEGYPYFPVCMNLNLESKGMDVTSTLAKQLLFNMTAQLKSIIQSVQV